MLDQLVYYLRAHDVPFRLFSEPSPEPLPEIAHPLPPGCLMVETQVLLVGGRAAVACMPRGSKLGLTALHQELGVPVLEGTPADLPPPFSRAAGYVPPLGGAMGLLTIVDQRLAISGAIAFMAFSTSDFIELPYDDFARVERPRVGSFAIGGELPEGHAAEGGERKAA